MNAAVLRLLALAAADVLDGRITADEAINFIIASVNALGETGVSVDMIRRAVVGMVGTLGEFLAKLPQPVDTGNPRDDAGGYQGADQPATPYVPLPNDDPARGG